MTDLISLTANGLYCEVGDFYIDPWRPVPFAVITHAHADHARVGSSRYLTTTQGRHVLQTRMGPTARIETVDYGQTLSRNGVTISLHPAGHVLGSAQIRVEHRGEVWVVTGDYKVTPDQTCQPFEPVRCHTLISECTFGLPIYRWQPQEDVFAEINAWWRQNRDGGRVSLVCAYSLGKAQRVLAGVEAGIAPIYCHGAVERVNADYRETGVSLPKTEYAGRGTPQRDWQGALIVAPPSAVGTPWMRKFKNPATAFASGWMRIRGTRRRRAVDRGFVLSDHADWPGLLSAIKASEAERVLLTHGPTGPMVRWLQEAGYQAETLATEFQGERDDHDVEDTADHDPTDEETQPESSNAEVTS